MCYEHNIVPLRLDVVLMRELSDLRRLGFA